MSSWASPIPAATATPRLRARPSRRLGQGPTRLAAFAAMSLFASLEYATLLQHVPAARVLAIVALLTLAGAAMQLADAHLARRGRRTVPALALLAALALALLAAGVPAHLLAPGGWGSLARHVDHGVSALGSWLWPYRGRDVWAERAVLIVLPAVVGAAAALCFWPARAPAAQGAARARRVERRELRRGVALLALMALYLTGVANAPARLDGLRGLVLGLLVAAWLWLPGLRLDEAPRAARWLLAGVLVALLLRPVLSSPRSWIDYRETSGDVQQTASFQWDQLYGPITWSRSAATMFEVFDSRPALLRVTSLDRFDGLHFLRSSAPPGSRRLDLAQDTSLALRTAEVSVAGLRSQLLVSGGGVARRARWLGSGSPLLRRAADGTFAAPRTVRGGALYEVTSYEPQVTPAQLRAAPRKFPRMYLPYAQFELPGRGASGLSHPNLLLESREQPVLGTLIGPATPGARPGADAALARRLAGSPYGQMFALVQRLARGARSDYEIALRVRQYLLANYAYSEHVAQTRYPLEAFLFSQHAGYCQQFSGAMTLMLRMEGIPARVGAGFRPSVYDPRTGGWRIRALDAHAWVEVFFTGIGWVTFDPTPQARLASAESEGARSKALIESGSVPRAGHAPKPAAAARLTAAAGSSGSFPLLPVALAVLAALAAALLLHASLRARGRLRRGLAGDAEGALAELARALEARGDAGRPWGARAAAAPLTLVRLELQLRERGRDAAADYVRAIRAVRYARSDGGERPTQAGRAALRRALAAQAGRRCKLRVLAQMPPGGARRV